jgi:phosphatidylinositol-3-phosphatase
MPTRFLRRLAPVILTAALIASGTSAAFADQHDGKVSTAAAEVKHVFVIVLENKSFSDTFGTSTQDPNLQQTLVPMGSLLTQYYGTGHVSLDNYISMISGQSPTPRY